MIFSMMPGTWLVSWMAMSVISSFIGSLRGHQPRVQAIMIRQTATSTSGAGIEALGRQMAVCSFDGAARLIASDKGYWNIVSISGPRERKAELSLAKTIHYSCFDDVEITVSDDYRPPQRRGWLGLDLGTPATFARSRERRYRSDP